MGSATGVNWSGDFVNVQVLKVSFLKRDEALHLIIHPKEDYPGDTIFRQDVVDQIMYETGCHPFLIQAICSEIIDSLNSQKRERANILDVQDAIDQVLEAWNGYFNDLWIRTDDNQRACLAALLALDHADIQHIQQHSDLNEKLVRHTCKLSLSVTLRLNKDNTYQIATPIFRKWVEHNS